MASDSIQTYHVAVVGYLGCGLVLSTSAINGMIYTSIGAREAAAAGFILLAMVTVCLFRSNVLLATNKLDRLDLLLWLCPVGRAPGLHRLVRSVQGIDVGQPPDHERLRPPPRDIYLRAAPTNVYDSAQRS